jgi:hypothetical protein
MMTALRDALTKIEQQAIRQRQKTTTAMRHPRPVASVGGMDDTTAMQAVA